MRTSRVIAAAGLGLVLTLSGGTAAAAQTLPSPLAGAACQAGGGTPMQADLGAFGQGRACLGGSQTGATIAPPAGF